MQYDVEASFYDSTHFSCHPKQLKSYLYLKYNNSENGRDGRVKGLLTSGLHTTLMVRRVYILTAEIAIKIFTTSVFFQSCFFTIVGNKKNPQMGRMDYLESYIPSKQHKNINTKHISPNAILYYHTDTISSLNSNCFV